MELVNLIEHRETNIRRLKSFDRIPEIIVSHEFYSLLRNNGIPIKNIYDNTYSIETARTLTIIPSQYFYMLYESMPYLEELYKYVMILDTLDKTSPRFLQLYKEYASAPESSEELKSIVRSKLDNNETSTSYFLRFIKDDTEFRGGGRFPLDKGNIRIRDDYIDSAIRICMPIPNNNFEDFGKTARLILTNSEIYTIFARGDFFQLPNQDDDLTEVDFSRNRIIYGAPGTGKSYKLNSELGSRKFIRYTFNPETTYGQFVGTYKPVSDPEEDKIKYVLTPGPFLKALKVAQTEEVVLIIEEINRANVSAVFGDVFQLLDRKPDGSSEYKIQFGPDIMKHLKSEGIVSSEDMEVGLPSNLSIWATMNSADQGVFPLDSAFKRRWSFEYLNIDNGEAAINELDITINENVFCSWNELRKKINSFLKGMGIQEDKLIGPFFLNKSELKSGDGLKGKLLLYLWDDVLRHRGRNKLFNFGSLGDANDIISTSGSLTDFLRDFFKEEIATQIIPDEEE